MNRVGLGHKARPMQGPITYTHALNPKHLHPEFCTLTLWIQYSLTLEFGTNFPNVTNRGQVV